MLFINSILFIHKVSELVAHSGPEGRLNCISAITEAMGITLAFIITCVVLYAS